MKPDTFSVRDNNLVVHWPDRETVLSGSFLRAHCRCAGCRHLEITENKATHDNVAVLAVTPMGYGLQLHFNDGHNRGIYPWQYLREIATPQLSS